MNLIKKRKKERYIISELENSLANVGSENNYLIIGHGNRDGSQVARVLMSRAQLELKLLPS